jgi:hypothetical protein
VCTEVDRALRVDLGYLPHRCSLGGFPTDWEFCLIKNYKLQSLSKFAHIELKFYLYMFILYRFVGKKEVIQVLPRCVVSYLPQPHHAGSLAYPTAVTVGPLASSANLLLLQHSSTQHSYITLYFTSRCQLLLPNRNASSYPCRAVGIAPPASGLGKGDIKFLGFVSLCVREGREMSESKSF